MRNHGRFLLCSAPALLALMLASGCGTLPGTFGVSSEPTPSPTKTGTQHPLVAPAPSANSVAPVTGPGPAPVLPLNLVGPESPQDVISLQMQSIKTLEDDRKLMAARLLQLEAMLQDKERAHTEVVDEILAARDDVAHKLADIKRLRQEKGECQDKVSKLEKEVIDLRKQIIKMLEAKPDESKPDDPKMDEAKPE